MTRCVSAKISPFSIVQRQEYLWPMAMPCLGYYPYKRQKIGDNFVDDLYLLYTIRMQDENLRIKCVLILDGLLILIFRGGASEAASGGRMGGGLMCWGGESHNCEYKITNLVPKYSRLRLIGSLWFQSILTRLSGKIGVAPIKRSKLILFLWFCSWPSDPINR